MKDNLERILSYFCDTNVILVLYISVQKSVNINVKCLTSR